MFEDIDKTLALTNCIRGAPKFLLALGLCYYTEYWGKLSEGAVFDLIMRKYCTNNYFLYIYLDYNYLVLLIYECLKI
jgi:hypothetical protein